MVQILHSLIGFSSDSPPSSSTFTPLSQDDSTGGDPDQVVDSPQSPPRLTIEQDPEQVPDDVFYLHSTLTRPTLSFKDTLYTLLTASIVILSSVGLWSLMTSGLLLKGRLPTHVRYTNETGFSGWAAMTHLQHISASPHMYNSDANLQVRQYIIREVQRLMSVSKPTRLLLDTQDTINLTLPSLGPLWYESNNVLVRLVGKQSLNALLVSTHFDSTPISFGATDAGVAVAVMLETIRLLSSSEPLDYDIVFNFNNGEEMKLLGAYAFLFHPWFKDCKAFINLEGTGAASGTRSMLFRTHSHALAKAYAHSAPYPHASILVNDLMRFVRSDTDYRAYYAYGGLPGLDVAFYSYRYLYHTPRDDIHHVSPYSVQHMGDNVMGFIDYMGRNETGVMDKLVHKTPSFIMDPSGPLPSAGFPFYDIMGQFMIVLNQRYYLMILNALLIFVMAAMIVKALFAFAQGHPLGYHVIQSSVSFILVWLIVIMSLIGVAGGSYIKCLWNTPSTFVAPGINMMWIMAWILLCFTSSLHMIDTLVSRLYHRIQSTWFLYYPIESNAVFQFNTRLGLFYFWYSWVVMVTLMASDGWNGGYTLVFWFYATCVTECVLVLLDSMLLVWKQQQQHLVFIQWYEKYKECIYYTLSTSVPMIMTLDVFDQVYIAVPSLLAENMGFITGDVVLGVFACMSMVNLLPVLRHGDIKAITAISLAAFIILFTSASTIFPFTYDRPHKMRFSQEWNITTSSSRLSSRVTLTNMATLSNTELLALLPHFTDRLRNGTCHQDACYFDTVTVPHLTEFDYFDDASDMLTMTLAQQVCLKDQCRIEGTLRGTPRSRICSLEIDPPVFHLVMDTLPGWKTLNTSSSISHTTSSATLFRRSYFPLPSNYTEGDRIDALRISTQFSLVYPDETRNMTLKWGCFHSEIDASETFRRLVSLNASLGALPDYFTLTHGRYGGVYIYKTMMI